MTLQFWTALKRPPIHHPLFRRASKRPAPVERRLTPLQQIAILGACALLAGIGLYNHADMIFVALFFIPIGVAALYMLLHGTLAGAYWAVRVSGTIARERERGMYELLATSPYGAFSASWAICTGCQYYDQTFNGAGAQRVWFSRIFFLTLVLLTLATSLAEPRSPAAQTLDGFAKASLLVGLMAVAFHVDDIHSTVIGSLVGLIVPNFVRQQLNVRVCALMGFLTLQVFAYAVVWLLAFDALPRLNASAAWDGLALPIEQLLIFFAVREGISRVLWWLHTLLMDGDVSDLRGLTKGGRLVW